MVPVVMVEETGSSPRMRGARMPLDQMQQLVRIIPADAGSTRCRPPHTRQAGDHPLGYGEHQ